MARAWRDALAEPSLWTRLDFTYPGDISFAHDASAARRGAAGRARGQLAYLDLWVRNVSASTQLLDVVAANGGSLRELRVGQQLPTRLAAAASGDGKAVSVEAIMRAAPLLQVFEASIFCLWHEVPNLLRGAAGFGPLRLRALCVQCFDGGAGGDLRTGFFVPGPLGPLAAALADAALQPTLVELEIRGADTRAPGALDALVDAGVVHTAPWLLRLDCAPAGDAPGPAAEAEALVRRRQLRCGAWCGRRRAQGSACMHDSRGCAPRCGVRGGVRTCVLRRARRGRASVRARLAGGMPLPRHSRDLATALRPSDMACARRSPRSASCTAACTSRAPSVRCLSLLASRDASSTRRSNMSHTSD